MLRKLGLAVLYTAFALGANPGMAEVPAEIAPLLTGEMQKMVLLEVPKPLAAAELLTGDEAPASLDAYRGKWVLLNFWATWCAPCRTEMPSLDRLQAHMPDLAVVPVATGRNAPEAIARFYKEAGVVNLPVLRDPKAALSRSAGVLGLPVTLILNPEGEEVGRLIGGAEWDSPEALALLDALMPAD